MIVRVNLVMSSTVVLDSAWRFDNTCAELNFRVKVICNTSFYGSKLWLFTVIGQLSRDVTAHDCIFGCK